MNILNRLTPAMSFKWFVFDVQVLNRAIRVNDGHSQLQVSLISPNRSINTQVPSPKMNMVSAPFNEEPAEAATNHIDDSIPQGITAVSKPIINGVPLNPQGDVSPGRNLRRSGTPHI